MTDLLGGRGRARAASRVRPRDDSDRARRAALCVSVARRAAGLGEPRRLRRRRAAGIRRDGHERERAGRGDGGAGSPALRAALPPGSRAHRSRHRHPPQLRLRRLRLHAATGRWRRSWTRRSAASARRSADGRVVCGLSGGVDSTVAALLIHRAIGDRLTCIFVDNGVMRLDEARADPAALRAAGAAARVRRRLAAVSRSPGRHHRSGAQAQDHRRHLHRRLRGGSGASSDRSTSSRRARSIRT